MDRSALRRSLPAAAFACVLLVTSLIPVPEGPSEQVPTLLGFALDKWVHAASYGALTALLAWGRRARGVTSVATLVAVSVCYGAGVELLQTLVPSRGTSGVDFAANASGAVLVGLAWLVVCQADALSGRPALDSRQ